MLEVFDAARHARPFAQLISLSIKQRLRTCALDRYICREESGSSEAIRHARAMVCLLSGQMIRIRSWIDTMPEGMRFRKSRIRERIGRAETMESEEVFFVTFVFL